MEKSESVNTEFGCTHATNPPDISSLSTTGAPVSSTPALILNTCNNEAMKIDRVLSLRWRPGQILHHILER